MKNANNCNVCQRTQDNHEDMDHDFEVRAESTTRRNDVVAEERREAIERIEEIRDEIKELVNEAFDLIDDDSEGTKARAKAYWYGHVVSALDDDHQFLGRSGGTMQSTIDELIESLEDVETELDDVEETEEPEAPAAPEGSILAFVQESKGVVGTEDVEAAPAYSNVTITILYEDGRTWQTTKSGERAEVRRTAELWALASLEEESTKRPVFLVIADQSVPEWKWLVREPKPVNGFGAMVTESPNAAY